MNNVDFHTRKLRFKIANLYKMKPCVEVISVCKTKLDSEKEKSTFNESYINFRCHFPIQLMLNLL